jgi:hypothetical protein
MKKFRLSGNKILAILKQAQAGTQARTNVDSTV